MKMVIAVLSVMFLGGCFAGVETRSGWHMLSIPPSSGRRLAAQCTYVPLLQKLEDRGITDVKINSVLGLTDRPAKGDR